MFKIQTWFMHLCKVKTLCEVQTIWKNLLEPVCFEKQQKEVPDQLVVNDLRNKGPLKILNGIKLNLDDQGNHLYS